MTVTKFGIGQPLRRVEDHRLLTGGGHYGDDHAPEGCLHAALLRSPHAHARFRITDVSTACAMPGVRLVLTAADVANLGEIKCQAPLPNDDGSQNHLAHIPVLAKDTAKHVGDGIAFVVADTLAQARDAVEAIGIDYEVLPAVVGIRNALKSGVAAVWDEAKDNLAYDASMGDKEAVDAAFAKANRVVRIEVENQRVVTNYMETRSVVAEYDGATDSLTLTIPSQGVHGLRDTIAGVLGVAKEKLRVVTGDVGGGFGTKAFTYREYPLAAEAARRLGGPVKWVSDRGEHFVADSQGRDNLSVGEVALDGDGHFLAMRFDVVGDLGAYLSQFGPFIPYLGATMLTGVYRTPALHVRVRGVYTNTLPVDAYRGAGRPEAAYLVERLVDRAARETGLTQDEIRRRNFIPASAMPYKTPIGDRTYDTGNFEAHMRRAMEASDWAGFEARHAESRRAGRLRGIGLATYIECTAWGEGEDVKIALDKDGGATVYVGTQSNGQGHATAYAQFAAEQLDLPPERIRLVQGDTARITTGNGTGGSRSIPIGGICVNAASKNLADKLKELAAEELETAVGDLEIAEGAVRVAGTDRAIDFATLAALPRATEAMLTGQGDFVPPSATYPNGTHVAEVEIDPETGITSIVRYAVCDDFGATVNPLLLAGQVHGGVAQGIGQALHERTVYDADGQLLTASLMDYAVPRAEDVPFFHFETKNVPSTTNPMGIKGAGEAGSIGSCPAVMNAVVDALDRSAGVRDLNMPATPASIFAALRTTRIAAA
ncbi:xanthine dehydrogenase family protein molybdopterin-binding subunit [Methylobacterium nodulans]|uniref:Aldehyde oxidase and xanthine dehydrogenase molybdopterin binding n=1 Tax=Methylobacterium nodulans (strain LMG 21967 / CNCM I-2342 / ORS 2060) TaxID=460265 RepID=B8IJP7_METNO|nr:xanthine dehydrogenase family protein molybdopterin-binding subunit [Methylobacterium nodulans]ACL58095.1 aldehyde oxidase and xanthine dehydrogenase molybdopterin binding [Methylobacterium nodulans ORS 2060]